MKSLQRFAIAAILLVVLIAGTSFASDASKAPSDLPAHGCVLALQMAGDGSVLKGLLHPIAATKNGIALAKAYNEAVAAKKALSESQTTNKKVMNALAIKLEGGADYGLSKMSKEAQLKVDAAKTPAEVTEIFADYKKRAIDQVTHVVLVQNARTEAQKTVKTIIENFETKEHGSFYVKTQVDTFGENLIQLASKSDSSSEIEQLVKEFKEKAAKEYSRLIHERHVLELRAEWKPTLKILTRPF